MHLTGDRAKADAMTQRAIDCYQRNGATAPRAPAGWPDNGPVQLNNTEEQVVGGELAVYRGRRPGSRGNSTLQQAPGLLRVPGELH
jgi:hypothetical protein